MPEHARALQASVISAYRTGCLAAAAAVLLPAGKEEEQLRRLLNENEEVARQRDSLRKRLELMERAAREIMQFRV